MEVIPGIYQVRLPLPFTPIGEAPMGQVVSQTNIYLIRGNAGWLQVDAGWNAPETFEAYKEGIREIGINLEDISEIIITHAHLDHFGLAGKIKGLSGAQLALHEKERYFIEPGDKTFEQIAREMKEWLYQNGTPEDNIPGSQRIPKGPIKFISPILPDLVFFRGDIGDPDIFFSGGERINTGPFDFEVLWTPGHSPGHICLYERQKKVLISGDHILAEITPEIGFSPFSSSSSDPLGDYIDSLKDLRGLDVERVLPAHGDCFSHLQGRIDELIQHHENRKETILQFLGNKPATAYEIASKLPWMPQKGGVSWAELDHLNRRMALMETLAHLKILEKEKKVDTSYRDGREFYSAA
jgi:glyoxylase-like metal-dependent hydrolase (beta-lactamase superfamily II)